MQPIEIDIHNIVAANAVIPRDKRIVMLNLLRYNDQATYTGGTDLAPCSGREAYLERYAPAFNQAAAALGITGIEVLYVGNVLAGLVVPSNEKWDAVVLVNYPDFAAFRGVVESLFYLEQADQHRKAALADWRLIATETFGL